MRFQTVSVIKHESRIVWAAMRDDLPKIVHFLGDIESVTEQQRCETKEHCKIVNIWKASPRLPQALVKFIDSDMFMWTDRAEWDNRMQTCNWSIELHHFRDSIQCHGSTLFQPAMGGAGTKVTFSGDLNWNSRKLLGSASFLGETALSAAEGIIRNILQKNFRKIAEALGQYLDEKNRC